MDLDRLMWDVMERLVPTSRVFCSPDYDAAAEMLASLLAARVRTYPAAQERNGWVIHPRWAVRAATISRDGKLLYDGRHHALAVIALSRTFHGRVSREELREHLHFDHRYPDALPYHFRQLYRPWDRDWGFCVPRRFYDGLEEGSYDVVIETDEGPGDLKIVDAILPGRRPETILFAAHLDHPGMANDDLAGCAVGVALMQWLRARSRKFTYRLVLHPEVIGPEYFLPSLAPHERSLICDGLFLEMLGTETKLGLQRSLSGPDHLLARMEAYCREEGIAHRSGAYGEVVVNGEYVWESHGVSLASLSRYPYPEYHSSRDNLSIIAPRALSESLAIVQAGVAALESEPVLFKDFEGTLCLSNPAYDLYVDPGQLAFGGVADDALRQGIRRCMELLPTLRGPEPIRELSVRFGLPAEVLMDYLRRWEEKRLVAIL
ncbi:MAG: DUF4910 domain-containing protein [Candidatus Eisenbacteria bacterium]